MPYKLRIFCAFALIVVLADKSAAVPLYMFTTPDAPLPSGSGDGLNARFWAAVDVDTLADADAYIAVNNPYASFISTVVDYPNGSAGSTSTSTRVKDALGVDAASLSNPLVGELPVLNSIAQFQGFLRVDTPGSLLLGVASDDGSRLKIQGTSVFENDGIHVFPGVGPVEIAFTSVGLYALDILFFESQRAEWGIEFYLDTPSNGTPVPGNLLYRTIGDLAPVPEPGTLYLLIAGGMAGMFCRRSYRILAKQR